MQGGAGRPGQPGQVPQSHTALSHPGNMHGLLVRLRLPADILPAWWLPVAPAYALQAAMCPVLASAGRCKANTHTHTHTPPPPPQALSGLRISCVQERKVAADSLRGLAEEFREALPLLVRASPSSPGQPPPLDGFQQTLRAALDVSSLERLSSG